MVFFLVASVSISCLFGLPNNSIDERINEQLNSIIDGINENIIFQENLKFDSVEVEYIRQIENVETKEQMYFVDFVDNNGFLLLDTDFDVFLFDNDNDYSIVKESKEVFYREYSIFCDGEKISLGTEKQETQSVYAEGATSNYNYIEYNGVESYIQTHYSNSNFTLTSFDKLDSLIDTTNKTGLQQYQNSVFKKVDENGNNLSEPNCVIVSLANVFEYYYWYKDYSLLPCSGGSMINSEEDILYPYIDDAGYTVKSDNVHIARSVKIAREKAYECGYRLNALSKTQAKYIFEELSSDYGYNGTHSIQSSFTTSDIVTEISNDRPLQLFVDSDYKYNNHAMMITGYKVYNATVNMGMFNAYLQLVFVSVYDGHSTQERWYDMTYLSNLDSSYDRASQQEIAKLQLI